MLKYNTRITLCIVAFRAVSFCVLKDLLTPCYICSRLKAFLGGSSKHSISHVSKPFELLNVRYKINAMLIPKKKKLWYIFWHWFFFINLARMF